MKNSTTEDRAKLYSQGLCQDCEVKIQPLGASSRCASCDVTHQEYIDSGWGLDAIAEERSRNKELGLCFRCGDGLNETDDRLCNVCKSNERNERWCREQIRVERSNESNPYRGLWDSHDSDSSVNLTPTHEIMAKRMRSKADSYLHRARRGGPRGRAYMQEAVDFNGIANHLQSKADELKRNR